MGTLLDRLYDLHKLTSQYYQLKERVESEERRARVQARKLAGHEEQIEAMRDQIQHAQAAAGSAELDLKTRDASLDRLRAQLNTTKTNKEYSALLREINTFKADSSRLEEDALRKMGEVDVLKGKLAELQKMADTERARLSELQAAGQGRVNEIQSQIDHVQKQRRLVASELPADVVAQLDRLAEGLGGEAMASIVQPNAKREEFICTGCNIGVTLETVNALRSRDDIQTCHTCGRLLYLGDSAVKPNRP